MIPTEDFQRVEVPAPETLVSLLKEADREARLATERLQLVIQTAVAAFGFPVSVADSPIEVKEASIVLSVPRPVLTPEASTS